MYSMSVLPFKQRHHHEINIIQDTKKVGPRNWPPPTSLTYPPAIPWEEDTDEFRLNEEKYPFTLAHYDNEYESMRSITYIHGLAYLC